MSNNSLLAREWIRKSQDDEASIKAVLKEKSAPTTACFLSQQLAEKCLKGLLSFYELDAPKTHDLLNLESLLIDILPEIKELHDALTLLNRYYIETRYPGDFPEDYTWDMAEESFSAALAVKQFALDRLF